jgi:hypothetical protein
LSFFLLLTRTLQKEKQSFDQLRIDGFAATVVRF